MRLLPALLLAALAFPAVAQDTPVKVTADTFVVNEAQSAATFSGNVVVVRGDLTVWADTVDVAYAQGGSQTVKTITARGHVRLRTPDQTATGERAVYTPASQIMRLTGNVTVVNANGTVNGPELVLNLADGVTTFAGGKGGRVTGEFTAQ